VLPDCENLRLKVAGCVLHLTLNRPAVRNALSSAMWSEIAAVFAAIEGERAIRAVILRGAGGNFCSGGDLKERASIESGDGRDPLWERNRMGGRILSQIESAPQVVVSAVEGVAIGGGLGLACASDVTFCTLNARFALPEVTLGILPAQVAPFLLRRLGEAQTRRLALTAASIDGAEAAHIGLAHEVCADGAGLDGAIAAFGERIDRCAPQALAATKRLIRGSQRIPLEEQLDTAATAFVAAVRGAEGVEGSAARREKRAPSWNGP
jgi:isohexenylglutaconyl-CoA hydratase